MISQRSKRADIKELKIFDNFKVDETLPKYAGKEIRNNNGETRFIIQGNSNDSTSTNTTPQAWVSVPDDDNWIDSDSLGVDKKKLNFWQRIRLFFTTNKLIKKKEAQKKKEKLVSIRNYFTHFADSFNELTPLAEIADHYEKAILQAEKLGQKSLLEKLKDMLEVVKGEAVLIQMGVTYYVTNEQVCDFYESVDEDKNLKLTWIQNFVKVIPNEVVEIKNKIDEKGIFDNYVILHYDPQGNASSMTKEEIEVKKDPILFGVIKNSKRLYYVADWIDDYCDLTLENMFETLGEKTLEINNRNLKTYINKVGDYEQKRKKLYKTEKKPKISHKRKK